MTTFTIVRQEHLNHHGYLFGGAMLSWVDEFAWLTAARDFPGCTLVTRAMGDIEFKRHVACGAILRFHILPEERGRSSITYRVDVHADEPGADTEQHVFSTRVVLVRVDPQGEKCPLPQTGALRSECESSCD